MSKLSQVYDVTTNIRGLSRLGYCRPTVKNFLLGPDDKYAPTWCGGGMPPDWFPEETWDGYPVWPEGLGTQPNYDGPFKPKHPNIPWPGPELGADGTTGTSVPGTPSIVSISINGTTATIIAIPPEDNGGTEILYYTATSNPGGITGTGTMGEENIMIEVTGLTPDTEYTFTVTATNEIGTGTPSISSDPVIATALESGNIIGFNVSDTNGETFPIEGNDGIGSYKFLYESSSVKEFDFDYTTYDVAPQEFRFSNYLNDTYGCSITKIELLESGSWVDRTAPANWTSTLDMAWNGVNWAMSGSGTLDRLFGDYTYRPTKVRITYAISILPLEVPALPVFHLRSNTTDGSTVFTDISETPHPISAYGGVKHSTEQLYDGNSSIKFSSATYPIDRLQVPASADFNFGTSDFEISFNIWKADYNTSSATYVFEIYRAGYSLRIYQNEIALVDGGMVICSTTAPSTSAWHEIKITRVATVFYLYIDGVVVNTNSEWTMDFGGNLILYIGGNDLNTNKPLNAYIDDFKIIKK